MVESLICWRLNKVSQFVRFLVILSIPRNSVIHSDWILNFSNGVKDANPFDIESFNFSNGVKDANPFDDESEEWDDGAYVLTDNGEAGTPVKALYDYEAAEPDELSFKTGKYSVSHHRCP